MSDVRSDVCSSDLAWGGRQTGSDGGAVAGGEVAFDVGHVLEDFVVLRQQFRDGGHGAVRILTLRQIHQGPVFVAESGHGAFSRNEKPDRPSVVEGKSGSVSVYLGWWRLITKTQEHV